MMCRHSPAAVKTGISQVAKPQNTTAAPSIMPRVALTMGASAISTIRAPARIVMAQAPMATQYGGSRSTGRNSNHIMRAATNMPAAAYRNTPTDHAHTATMASAFCIDGIVGSSVAEATAIDWLATTQINQEPLAWATTGRSTRLNTAVHGMTYPRASHVTTATISNTAVVMWCPDSAIRTPRTLVPAINVKNPKARRGAVKSFHSSCG